MSNTHNSKQESMTQIYSTVSVCNEPFCESHKIHECPQFKYMSDSDRTKVAKSKHLCSTSLLTGLSVSACSSEYTWTECNLKYHTHLHRDRKLQKNSSNKKAVQANAYSTESEDKPQTAVVNSHCKASHEGQERYSSFAISTSGSVLFSRVYVSLCDNTGKG